MSQDEIPPLIKKARAGDRSAFDKLLELHGDRLKSWIKSRLGEKVRQRVDVDDLLQETHLRAFQSIQRFSWRHEDSFYRWLCIIAEHLIWNVSQKRPLEDLSLAIDTPDGGITASRGMRREERFERLEKSLKTLKHDEREVVRLSRIEGFRIREIAGRMKKSEAAVKSLLLRSLKKLRESFGDTESFHLPDRCLNAGSTSDVGGSAEEGGIHG